MFGLVDIELRETVIFPVTINRISEIRILVNREIKIYIYIDILNIIVHKNKSAELS